MTLAKTLFPALILTLATAACGGGGGGGGGAPTAVPTAVPTPTPAPSPSPTPKPTLGPSATISDSGSTNRAAFTIVMQTDGTAQVTQKNATRSGTVSASTTNTFFSDLNANLPVSKLPISSMCTKSSSFGSTTTITYQAATTGDVSCPPTGSSTATVFNDVQQIESALNL